MDYPETQMMIHRASQIRLIAEDMSRINNVNLCDAADTLSAVWRGDAANAFQQHCATTRDQVRNTVSELHRVADEMERTAKSLEQQ